MKGKFFKLLQLCCALLLFAAPLSAQSVYVSIADYDLAPTSGIFSLDVQTGALTPVKTNIIGYNVALGVSPDGKKFYLSETPQDPTGLPSNIRTLVNPPAISDTAQSTSMTIIGPRMCVSQDGNYVYSVHTVTPTIAGNGFLRRSSIATGQSVNAQLKDAAGNDVSIEQNGDVIMAGDGMLYFTDGAGRFFKVNPNTATWDTTTPGYAGSASALQLGVMPTPFTFPSSDLYYSLAMASDGNLYALGLKKIYKFDLSTNPLQTVGPGIDIKYADAGLPASSIAIDAASNYFLKLFNTVSGHVYYDYNKNGILNTGDNGIGITLYAKLVNALTGQVYAVATVDPITGFYQFPSGVPNGNFTMTFSTNNTTSPLTVVPASWENTTITTLPVTMANADVINVDFGLAPLGPLPIELVSFEIIKKGEQQVEVKWVTASERNNSYFVVERSNDGRDFKAIGLPVAGRGNSNTTTVYNLIDEKPFVGYNYYRMRQVDFDGKYSESRIVPIFFSKNAGQIFVFPNPVSTDVKIALKGIGKGDFQFDILNLNGQTIYSERATIEDENFQTFIENHFTNGVYFLRSINLSSGDAFVEKFIVEDLR